MKTKCPECGKEIDTLDILYMTHECPVEAACATDTSDPDEEGSEDDKESDPRFDVPYIGKTCYCTICGQNPVDAGAGFDTCDECLRRM